MTAPDPAVTAVRDLARTLHASLAQVLRGKAGAIDAVITTMLAGGHVLLEDVPGVGKTTLATALAGSVSAEVRRIQFTSDMLPTDVTGVTVYDDDTRRFRFHPGPVFTNFAVGDEVNRASPRTQSALLEAMAERRVTVDGTTHDLPELFMVIATQNPQDMAGTFPLPEAQRDRFMTRISLGYPEQDAEIDMVLSHGGRRPEELVRPVVTVSDVLVAQRAVRAIAVGEPVARYLVDIVSATRRHDGIALGASPRATLHLTRAARARAAMQGRSFVTPDDVAHLAAMVLPHRLSLRGRFATVGDAHITAVQLVSQIVASTGLR
ncbi:MoxR family ATPase [uncultured Corynebacterium sp.]|uniref:AAA family ATPase n=1 Tax=uncultured Corynebacterium sp. TaxID=159447 RepID=UPI0025F1800F|nr:MoxR family ATPase [uncultured Corynebacterium sp.]